MTTRDKSSNSVTVTDRDEILRQLIAKWRTSADRVAPRRGVPLFERNEFKYNTLMDCADELEAVLASLIGGAPQTGWQPISTAPKYAGGDSPPERKSNG